MTPDCACPSTQIGGRVFIMSHKPIIVKLGGKGSAPFRFAPRDLDFYRWARIFG